MLHTVQTLKNLLWTQRATSGVAVLPCRITARARLFLIMAASVLLPAMVTAQTTTATLTGSITDPSGSAVSGAGIVARNTATGEQRSTTSGTDGHYSFTLLPPAIYELRIKQAGFAVVVQAKVLLSVGGTVTDDVKLAIGSVDQVVQVTAEQGVLDTAGADVSKVVGLHEIESLPNIGRNFVSFVKLDSNIRLGRENVGGGPFKEPDTGVGVAAVPRLSFGGQSELHTMLQVDGVDNVQTWTGLPRATPSQEAVQEFRVVNSTYLAEYGRSLAGFVNIVTKSGTGKLTGAAYFYGINNYLNARPALSTPSTAVLRQNQFGMTLGGAVQKEKTFFFINYEGQRRAQSNNFAPLVLQNLAAINAVKTRFNLTPETINQLRTNDYDQGWAKFDHHFNAKNTLTARYNYLRSDTLNYPGGSGRGATASSTARNAFVKDEDIVASDVAVLTPKLVNEARFQYARRNFAYPAVHQEPTLEVSNLLLTGKSYADFDAYQEKRYEGTEAATYASGAHVIRFGTDFNYLKDYSDWAVFFPARIIFPSLPALLAFSPTSSNPANGPVVFWWPFLATSTTYPGFPLPFNEAIPSIWRNSQYLNFNHQSYGAFIQDQWKVGKKLTVSGGVRYDVETLPSPYHTQTDTTEFQPRLGFAFGATPTTVIRGGVGMFTGRIAGSTGQIINGAYELSHGNLPHSQALYPNISQVAGQYTVATVTTGQGPGAPSAAAIHFLQTGFAPQQSCLTTAPVGCVASQTDNTDGTLKNPFSLQASAQVEQEISKDISVTFGYLYVHSERNPLHSPNLNAEATTPTGTEADGIPIYGNRAYSDVGDLFVIGNFGFSTYNGGSVAVTKRLSQNYSLRGGYTWSKTLSNGDGIANTADYPVTTFKNERGLSRQDLRHRMNLSASASVPQNVRFARGIEVSAQGSVESGRPFTIFAGSDLNGDGDPNNDRAGHIVGSSACPAGCSLRRDSYMGPGFVSMDARIGKQFNFSQKYTVALSMDAFNLLNNLNVSDLNMVCGGVNVDACPNNTSPIPGIAVGSLKDVFNPRQLQFGAKVSF